MNVTQQVSLALWAYALLAAVTLTFCTGFWLLFAKRIRWAEFSFWFHPQRQPAQPWSGAEVAMAFAFMIGWRMLILGCVNQVLGKPDDDYTRAVQLHLAYVLALPFLLTSWIVLLRQSSGTRLYQMGLHSRRWPHAVLTGCIACLIVAPLIYGVNFLATWIMVEATGEIPEPHSLARLVAGRNPVWEWLLFLFSALVVAPLVEECFFRSIVQRWAITLHWRPHVIMLSAALIGIFPHDEPSREIAVFWLLLLPGYLLVPRFFPMPPRPVSEHGDELTDSPPLPSQPTTDFFDVYGRAHHTTPVRAIYAAAALFACVHAWPTPISLFLLGLVLGWLAYRTQSLIASMVLHCLFNGMACLMVALAKLVPEFREVMP
jgi:membrane protease YdiL (CAAX protease family)